MFDTNTIRRFRKNPSKTQYYVQGKRPIKLGKSDFKAQGGQGSIYVKGSTAYKIYTDPSQAIPNLKIAELSKLTLPNIIRPLDLLLDPSNKPIGYSMRYVGQSYALCQLFPKAFRQRNNLSPEVMLKLVRRLQEGVRHIHDNGILLVDLNEMNFLVKPDFGEIFFIDVDSYQTFSFPAVALMDSVRDRHAKTFSVNSDWFSFAIVSFQMLVGIHPFKGTYPPLQHVVEKEQKLDARMQLNISVLHSGVTVPPSCLPFTAIPPVYLAWYRSVFEEGKRTRPPDDVHAVLSITSQPDDVSLKSATFEFAETHTFDSNIISYDGQITITEQTIYFDGRSYQKPQFDVTLVVTARKRHLIAAFTDSSQLRFRDLTLGKYVITDIQGEAVMASDDQLFIKHQETILAVEFVELDTEVRMSLRPVANVMMRATQLFQGVAIQNLLGAHYASILKSSGTYQVRLPELDGYQVLDARLIRNVLILVGTSGARYDKFIFRFAAAFSKYDVRKLTDVSSTSINFTVLETGIVLHLVEDDRLEVFSRVRDSSGLRSFSDNTITDSQLFHSGKQALVAKGSKLYKFKLVV